MPPGDTPPTPDPAAAFRESIDLLVGHIRDLAPRPLPLLLDHSQAAEMVGVSRSAWFRLVGSPGFPAAIAVEGVGPRFRRQDVEKWVAGLRAKRKTPTRTAT